MYHRKKCMILTTLPKQYEFVIAATFGASKAPKITICNPLGILTIILKSLNFLRYSYFECSKQGILTAIFMFYGKN